ncbi:MAG TPA: Rap1a/Tai family immunity protein [Acidisarcina sp.]
MIIATVLFLALSQPSHHLTEQEVILGAFLFHECQALSLPDPSEADKVKGALCLAYIEGFTDGQIQGGPCVGRASYGDMAAAYVAWMKKHPDLMSMDKRVGVLMALGQVYTCSPKPY